MQFGWIGYEIELLRLKQTALLLASKCSMYLQPLFVCIIKGSLSTFPLLFD